MLRIETEKVRKCVNLNYSGRDEGITFFIGYFEKYGEAHYEISCNEETFTASRIEPKIEKDMITFKEGTVSYRDNFIVVEKTTPVGPSVMEFYEIDRKTFDEFVDELKRIYKL